MVSSVPIEVEVSPSQAINQGSKSFALASIFLPEFCRERVFQLYQWCRRCDDAIDEAPDAQSARSRLSRMEDRKSSGPLLSGPEWIDDWQRSEFIAGMRMDVENARYETIKDLEQYCFRVAGVVGLMMCPLLGAHPQMAAPHAVALGSAMQLTNIARDVQADARLGRIYIPQDLLLQVVEPDALSVYPELAYPAIVGLLKRADELYEYGLAGIEWLPWRVAFAIAIAGKVYQRIGHKLLRAATNNPQHAFRRRTVVSKLGKIVAVTHGIWLVIKIKI
jgi:phytoene synthase